MLKAKIFQGYSGDGIEALENEINAFLKECGGAMITITPTQSIAFNEEGGWLVIYTLLYDAVPKGG